MPTNKYLRNGKITSYTRNVSRQFGYAVGDVFSNYAPTTTSILKSSRDVARDVRRSMNRIQSDRSSSSTKRFSEGTDRNSDILADLASGRYFTSEFGNQTQSSSYNRRSEDWGDELSSGIQEVIDQNESNSKDLIASMSKVNNGVSRAIGISAAKSAEYIVSANMNATRALYDLNKQGFNQVTSVLLNVDNTLAGIASLGTPLTAHMQNSAIFYANTTDTLNKISDSLRNIEKNTLLSTRQAGGRNTSRKGFMENGIFDMKAYLDMVKDNYNTQSKIMQEEIFGKDYNNKRQNKSGMLGLALDLMMPRFMKSSIQMFDESLRNFITAGLSEAGVKARGSKNPLAALLGTIFLPRDDLRNQINTGNYEKGQVAWDGIARKSLVEVIPTYLAKIYAALGGEERYYDYNIGRFVNLKAIQGKREYDVSKAAKKAGGEYRKDAIKRSSNPEIQAEIEQYFLNTFKTGKGFVNNNTNNRKDTGLSQEAYDILVSLLNEYENSNYRKGNRKGDYYRNRGTGHVANTVRGRAELNRKMSEEEVAGVSNLNYLANGFTGKGNLKPTGIIDKYGNTSLDYLRGIYTVLSSGSGSGRRKRRNNFKLGKINDNGFVSGISSSSMGEKSNMDTNEDIYKYWGKTDEEIAIAKENKRIAKQFKDAKKKFEGDFNSEDGWDGQYDSENRSANLLNNIRNIYEKPFVMLSDFFNTATSSLNALFWGKDGEDGLITKMLDKFEDVTSKLKESISDKFKKWFGESEVAKSFKEQVSDSWSNIKDKAKNGLENAKNRFLYGKTIAQDLSGNGTAAKGRRVTKSGIVVVSEGELIIPSEYNPYYRGTTNKRQQMKNESRIYGKYYGSFADGGTVGGSDPIKVGRYYVGEDNNGNPTIYSRQNREYVDISNTLSESQRSKILEQYATLKNARNHFKEATTRDKNGNFKAEANSAGEVIGQGFRTLTGGIVKFFSESVGADPEKEKGKVFDVLKSVAGDAKNNVGNMFIGGLAGAGVSLLTGAVVGPLAGAAIGAGTGLILNSEKVQNALFGFETTDKDGKKVFNEGLFTQKQSEAIKKYVPSLGKGALAGLIGGTLMGSPVLGAFVGAGLGFAHESDSVKTFLFGNEDRDGLISKHLQDTLKKKAPRLIAGMAAGALFGPFGMLPNLMIGAGLGYVSDSEEFHEFMFGEKDGITSIIRNKIVYNLDDIFHNLKNTLIGSVRKLTADIGSKIKNLVSTLAKGFNRVIGKTKIGQKITKFAEGAVKLPFRIVGGGLTAINKGTKKFNLNRGYDVYDRNLGRNMTAEERNYARNATGAKGGKWEQFDDIIADASSEEQLNEYRDLLDSTTNAKSARKFMTERSVKNMLDQFGKNGLTKDNAKEQNKIANLLRRGKYDEAVSIANGIEGISNTQRKNIIAAMNTANGSIQDAQNDFNNKKNIRQIMEASGMNMSDGDIKNAINLIENEKSLRFSNEKKEEQKEQNEKDFKNNVTGFLANIDAALAKIAKIEPYSDSIAGDFKKNKEINKVIKEAGNAIKNEVDMENAEEELQERAEEQGGQIVTENGVTKYITKSGKIIRPKGKIGRKLLGLANKFGFINKHEDQEETGESASGSRLFRKLYGGSSNDQTTTDLFGVHQMTTNNQGETIENTNDKETKESNNRRNKFFNAINKIPGITTAITGITGLVSGISGKLFGSEKKEGVFTKLFKSLFGENGALTGILSLFTGSTGKLGTIVKSIVSNPATLLKGVFANIIGPGLLLGGFSGLFDGVASKLTNDAYNETSSKEGTTYTATTIDGETITYTYDSDGNKVDSNGNIIDNSTIASVDSATTGRKSFSDYSKQNTVRGVLTGTSSVASKVLGNTAVGKVVKSASKTLATAVEKGTAKTLLINNITDAVTKFTNALRKKIPILSKAADGIDNFGKALASKLGEAIESQTAKNIAKFASTAVAIARIAFVVVDFTTGYQDARSTLGITAEPTMGQKIVSGIIRTLKNCIPIVGTLLPDSLLVDLFVKYIAPALGIDMSDLEEQRSEAQAEVDQYNKDNGTNYSVQDYNKQVLGDYTWTEKISNKVSAFKENVSTKFSNFKSDVSENGLMSALGNTKVGQAVSKVGSTVKSFVSTNLNQKIDVLKYMKDGDLKGLWSDYSDENGDELSTFNKIITTYDKIMVTVPTAISWIGHKIWSGIKRIGSDGKEVITGIGTAFSTGSDIIKQQGELSEFLNIDGIISDDNIFHGIGTSLATVSRLVSFPVALVKKIGSNIKNWFTGIIGKVKTAVTDITGNETTLISLAKEGDISGVIDSKATDDPENPLNGIMGGINFLRKFTYVPMAAFFAAGNGIKNWFTGIIGKVKTAVTDINTNNTNIKTAATNGDISGVWSNEVTDDPENPIGGIMGAVNFVQKLSATPSALFHAAGNGIKEWWDKKTSAITTDVSTFSTALDTIKQAASDDDISSIWNTSATFSDDNPLKGIFNIGLGINKVFQTIVAIINKFVAPIKDLVEGVTGTVSNIKDAASNAVSNVKDTASNVWNSATSWIAGSGSGFVSQYDPRYSNMSMSGTNVASKGCGPAVLSMLEGKSMSNSLSRSRGYQNANGVSIDYFQNSLSSDGYDTQIITGGSSADIYGNLARGNKVVLLGRDINNTSKVNSPFGPGNHYVLATGLDRNGNVKINDPEMNRPTVYNPSILNSVSYGVAASRSGGRSKIRKPSYKVLRRLSGGDSENVASQVWYYLTKHGFTEQAAAGIMGNLKQETNMNPSIDKQGITCGIACWDYQNGTNALKTAASKAGKNWSDLSFQLDYLIETLPSAFNTYTGKSPYYYSTGEWCWWPTKMSLNDYKKLTSVNDAAEIFERVYERASKPNIANRQKYANEYYQQYTGKEGEPVTYTGSTSSTTGTTYVDSDTSSSSSSSGLGILSSITSIFSNAFGKFFNGSSNDSSSSSSDTVESSTNTSSSSSSGTTYSASDVNLTGTDGTSQQKAIVQKLLNIAGTLSYSMSGARNPDQGSADCSSTVNWAYKKTLGVDIGNSTPAIFSNSSTSVVDGPYGNSTSGTTSSQGPNESKLKPGDLLLYSRPTSDYTSGRSYRVGHVEMYAGDGKRIGHGGGKGPKITDLSKDSSRFIEAKRYNGFLSSGSGSIIPSYEDIALASGGSSGILLSSRVGRSTNASISGNRLIHKNYKFSGGDSAQEYTTSVLNNIATSASNNTNISKENLGKLLTAITNILQSISNNTADIGNIYNTIKTLNLGSVSTVSGGSSNQSTNNSSLNVTPVVINNQKSSSSEVDSNIISLVSVLADIAKG